MSGFLSLVFVLGSGFGRTRKAFPAHGEGAPVRTLGRMRSPLDRPLCILCLPEVFSLIMISLQPNAFLKRL